MSGEYVPSLLVCRIKFDFSLFSFVILSVYEYLPHYKSTPQHIKKSNKKAIPMFVAFSLGVIPLLKNILQMVIITLEGYK